MRGSLGIDWVIDLVSSGQRQLLAAFRSALAASKGRIVTVYNLLEGQVDH